MKHTSKKNILNYLNPEHKEYPHIVRFSGGRSSAMMTILLCEKNILKANRGDVIVFSNTSAEHPKTYKFAKACKKYIETEFKIPFFWIEYCTYEDAYRGKWKRHEGYKLINPIPIGKNKNGYRWRGEAFEEMVSHAGMMPNYHLRSCTSRLKIYPTHAFLSEWFAGNSENSHLGHWEDKPYLTLTNTYKTYDKKGGQMNSHEYKNYKKYSLKECQTYRTSQKWSDYTIAPVNFNNPHISFINREKVDLWSLKATKYISLLGLRADENKRVSNILSRTIFASGATTASCRIKTQPPYEHPYFPLHNLDVSKKDVLNFWDKRDFNLELDDGLGNCTFCFMKGDKALAELSKLPNPGKVKGTPSDFKWWSDFEKKYKRKVPSRNGSGNSTFGFYGKRGPMYSDLIAVAENSNGVDINLNKIPCDCTD